MKFFLMLYFEIRNLMHDLVAPPSGQVALDMARDDKMRQLLDVLPIKKVQRNVQRFEGPLLKVCRCHTQYLH